MANTKILTIKYSSLLADHIKDVVDDTSNSSLYVYTGVHGDIIGDTPETTDATRDIVDAYRNMIFGKRVANNDVALLTRNVPYVANTVYDMYDDTDTKLFEKDFFVIVNEGEFYHLYKCLNNNFGLATTVLPTIAVAITSPNYTFQTNDGYVWKYMYSATSSQYAQFSTYEYFPVFANTDVSAAALDGSIDVIHVEQTNLNIPGGGKRYDNYVSGTWSTDQLRILGNNYLYAISNSNISHTAGFYTGCLIYLSYGDGAGQYTTITDYTTNSSGNFISLKTPFPIDPSTSTSWEISPNVLITGDGKETVTAVARCLINATGSNSIYKVEMLEKGKDYSYCTAVAVANNSVTGDANNDGIISADEYRGFIAAELRPIYGPAGGHGYDQQNELGCNTVSVSCKFVGDGLGTLVANNRFQQIGIIENPLFANVDILIGSAIGTFTDGEVLWKIDPIRINANVCISNTSNVITCMTSVLANATILTSGNAGSYVPNGVLIIDGGTPVITGKLQVVTTKVVNVSIYNHGNGYTFNSSFSANLDLGAGANAIFNITTSASGNANSVSITYAGAYTTNPTLNNATVTGTIGGGSGTTVNVQMGVDTIKIYDQGAYAVLPVNTANNEALGNNGSGAQFILGFTVVNSSDFMNQLSIGDYVYITAADDSAQQLGVVGSIVNSTSMTIKTTGVFSCASAKMYLPRKTSSGSILSSNSTHILLGNVDGLVNTGDILVGNGSASKVVVNTISRNDVTKDLTSFIQLYKYNVSLLSGTFSENEPVFQGPNLQFSTANALVHSVVTGNTTILYTSNQVGQFSTNTSIYGDASGAVANITKTYSPELEFGSGKVLYMENLDPVYRANDTSQSLQIVLNF